jgi:hypothetical protein
MVYFCMARNVGQKLFSREIYDHEISTGYALATKTDINTYNVRQQSADTEAPC